MLPLAGHRRFGDDAPIGARPAVEHALVHGHLVSADRADERGHGLGDRLVVDLLHTGEGDDEAAGVDGAAAPDSVPLRVEVGVLLLDERTGESGLPGDEGLAARDVGVLRGLVVADEADEDDRSVEHLQRIRHLRPIDDSRVDHDDRPVELVEAGLDGEVLDQRLEAFPGLRANLFRDSCEHDVSFVTQLR